MSALYLYALASDPIDLSGLVGVQGEALSLMPFGPAVAVGGWVDQAPSLDAPTLVAQDALVRSLHARARALLPVRFGTMMADAQAIERAVTLHTATLVERLTRVRGCDQMTVRVIGRVGLRGQVGQVGRHPTPPGDTTHPTHPTDPPSLAPDSGERWRTSPTRSGREYMEARAALRAPSPALDAIAKAAAALQRGVRIEPLHRGGLEGSVYHLIERGSDADYRQAIESAASREGVRVRISGPSPPYAFADVTN